MIVKLLPVANKYIIDNKFIPPSPLSATRTAAILGFEAAQVVNFKVNPYEGRAELVNTYTKDEPLGLSTLGTPIYTDLSLLGCTYTDNVTNRVVTLPNDRVRANPTGQNNLSPTSGSAYYMNLESIIIQVNQSIRVIKTEIQGRNGTIKEYIGADDMQISVNGIITGKNGVYPKNEVIRLKEWLDAPVAKGVTAWWLNNLGVNNIVIESYSIPQTRGGYSYQVFSFNAVSDTPVELRIVGQ